MRISRLIACLLCGLIFCTCLVFAAGSGEAAEQKDFAQFSLILPPGWSGDEQTGFVSDNPEEYQLILGRKDDGENRFLAQVSIFLLPNPAGVSSQEAALKLAEAQGGSSEPREEGNFWVFEGEPRTHTVKGMATTRVRTTPEKMLIIIAQDPENLGSGEILQSLKGATPTARDLLGR